MSRRVYRASRRMISGGTEILSAPHPDKIDDLINSFLKLSRIGRRELVLEEIDMGSLVRTLVRSFAKQIKEYDILVNIGISADRGRQSRNGADRQQYSR